MVQLIVRNLDEEMVRRLNSLAAEHRRSAEAEHRAILRAALMSTCNKKSLKQVLREMPNVGLDEEFARDRRF